MLKGGNKGSNEEFPQYLEILTLQCCHIDASG